MKPQLDQPLQTHLPLRDDLPPEPLRAFLDAVANDPDPVEAALVFGDWLEEHGDARGQAVRWSVWKDSHGRTSTTRRTLARKLHAWLEHYLGDLVGPEHPGRTVEWSRGLLRMRVNAPAFPWTPWRVLMPRVWELIEAGWIAEVGFAGHGAERLLARIVDTLADLPRILLEGCDDTAVEALEGLPSLRGLRLSCCRLSAFVFNSLRAHPHLAELTVEGAVPTDLSLFDLPQLRSLRLHSGTTQASLQLRHLPELRDLHIGGLRFEGPLTLAALPALRLASIAGVTLAHGLTCRDLASLERLKLHNLEPPELRLETLPRLHTLDLPGVRLRCLYLDDLPGLTRLDLGRMQRWLHEVGLSRLPALTALHITNAPWLYRLLLKELPALAGPTLVGCPRCTVVRETSGR